MSPIAFGSVDTEQIDDKVKEEITDLRNRSEYIAKELRKRIGDFKCLVLGTIEYSKAVFIGNLNYRMTMPAVVVMARSVEDVQNVIKYARQNEIRLTVKNGGHSYMGYCLNEGGIVLDLSRLNGCSIDLDKKIVTIEGGAIWKDVYFQLLQQCPQHIIIGGQCGTVGVSGFTLGGGLSPFSRCYGLGIDNVIEMTIVTADGEVVTVSADDEGEKGDLFWALRGGGGGNFGVTVSFTSKLHKLQDERGRVVCGNLTWDLTEEQQRCDHSAMMEAFNKQDLPKELCVDALWNHDANGKLQGGMTVIYNGSARKAYEALDCLLKFGPTTNTLKQMHWTDWIHQDEGWGVMSEVYHHHASFIFAQHAITPEVTEIITKLIEESVEILKIGPGSKNACHFLWDHIGCESEKVDAKATPFYWRQGHYASNIKAQWTDPKQRDQAMKFIAHCKEKLLPFAIEHKAAYLNYIDGTVQNYQEAYYGQNYPRLQRVKTYWDKDNFFRFLQSIKPLKDGEKPLKIEDEVEAPSAEEILETKDAKTTLDWWATLGQLITPQELVPLKTPEQVYALDNDLRKRILAG